MVIFHSFLYVYQAGYSRKIRSGPMLVSYLVRQHSYLCCQKKWQHIDIFDINIAVIELLKDELIPLSERLRRAAVAGNRFCPRKAASSCPASWSEGPMGPSVTSTLRPRMHGEIPPKITGSISGLVEGTFFSCNFPLNL